MTLAPTLFAHRRRILKMALIKGKTPGEVDLWELHTSFVCDFETIAATVERFLSKALELNSDFSFISQIIPIFSSWKKKLLSCILGTDMLYYPNG